VIEKEILVKFSELPENIQEAICWNKHGKELFAISSSDLEKLDFLSPEEMSNSWLEYEGIIGYTDKILALHDVLFSKGFSADSKNVEKHGQV